jgi:hypothetical protein
MIKYTIYGSCQAGAIKSILSSCPEFAKQYEYVAVKPFFEMSRGDIDEFLTKTCPQLGLFIYMPLLDPHIKEAKTSNVLNHLGKDCHRIVFPRCYMSAYFPDVRQVRNRATGGWISAPSPYHNVALMRALASSPERATAELFESEINDVTYYNEKWLHELLKGDLERLACRERELLAAGTSHVVVISDFIRENYRKLQLFYTLNHPSRHLLQHICAGILSHLKLPLNYNSSIDPLRNSRSPIYPAVRRTLQLEFPQESFAAFAGKALTQSGYIELFSTGYGALENLNQITEDLIKLLPVRGS